ncbi:glycosyltransferase family 39 protein [Candidatus Microgenomates bacterium]|nr:glycosyltransferase family 39 protein [Candidatus Microgenomates bacterium]
MLRKSNWIIFLIIILAVILRFVGIYPGFPPYHSDEGMSYAQGIAIVQEKTLDAHGYPLAYAYPNVVPIINAILFKIIFIPLSWVKFCIVNTQGIVDGIIRFPLSVDGYKRIFQVDILGEREINVLTWGRMIAAGFGVGVCVLVYKLSKKLFNKNTALLAALFSSINFRQVLNSHINLPDIYNAFFLLLSMLFSLKILNSRKKIDYLLAGLLIGISFSTKFHIYAIFPFVVITLATYLEEKKKWYLYFLDQNLYLSAFTALLTVLVINPYHLIHIERTIYLLHDVSLKYGIGRLTFSSYAFWFLFNIGIGKLSLIILIIGIVWMLFKKHFQTIFLLSCVLPFFYVVTYATNGAFYTRNFVTITPILLIFVAFVIATVLEKKNKFLKALAIIVLLFLIFENLPNSVVTAYEYSKPWNFKVLDSWIQKNIPQNSTVSAHSSVVINVPGTKINKYEFDESFSLEEFREQKSDFAVANFDWVTNDFYWWMNRKSSQYWYKPVKEMEDQYSAMSIRELQDFSIYSLVNPWQAPDSDYIVAKIPQYKFKNKNLVIQISGPKDPKWISESIETKDMTGIVVEAKLKGGYIYLVFYSNLEDANSNENRIAVRLSSRDNLGEKLNQKNIISKIPESAKYFKVGYAKYNLVENVYLDNLNVYNAEVEVDLGNYKVEKAKIDTNVIFPNSHGNL